MQGAILTLPFAEKPDSKSYRKTCFSSLCIEVTLQMMVTVGHVVVLSHIPCALPLDFGCVALHIHSAPQLSQLELGCLASDFLHALQ